MIDPETGEIKEYKGYIDLPFNAGPFMRTPYNYDRNEASDQSGLACPEPTKTQQQFAEEVDINTIVERFGLTGELPQNLRVPLTDEFVETMDYQTSLNKIIEADEAFMRMPAAIRADFQNDSAKFVDFVSNPANVEQCRKWGLAMPASAPEEPMRVRVVQEGLPAGPSE